MRWRTANRRRGRRRTRGPVVRYERLPHWPEFRGWPYHAEIPYHEFSSLLRWLFSISPPSFILGDLVGQSGPYEITVASAGGGWRLRQR